ALRLAPEDYVGSIATLRLANVTKQVPRGHSRASRNSPAPRLRRHRCRQPAARALPTAQTASLAEPQWSCVATRIHVSAGVEADRVRAAIRKEQECPARSVGFLRVPRSWKRQSRRAGRPHSVSALR